MERKSTPSSPTPAAQKPNSLPRRANQQSQNASSSASHALFDPPSQPTSFPDPQLQSLPNLSPDFHLPPPANRPNVTHDALTAAPACGGHLTQPKPLATQPITMVLSSSHSIPCGLAGCYGGHPTLAESSILDSAPARSPDARCTNEQTYLAENLLIQIPKRLHQNKYIAGLVEDLGSAFPRVAFARRMSQGTGRCSCPIR